MPIDIVPIFNLNATISLSPTGHFKKMGIQMEQTVFTYEKDCRVIGHPDFTRNTCRHCREGAEPIYKQCLTLRVQDTDGISNWEKAHDYAGPLEFSKNL